MLKNCLLKYAKSTLKNLQQLLLPGVSYSISKKFSNVVSPGGEDHEHRDRVSDVDESEKKPVVDEKLKNPRGQKNRDIEHMPGEDLPLSDDEALSHHHKTGMEENIEESIKRQKPPKFSEKSDYEINIHLSLKNLKSMHNTFT